MNPYELAWNAYHSRGIPATSFHEILSRHLMYGVVVSTQDVFVMARAVRHTWPDLAHQCLSPLTFSEPPDCWHIWLAAGDLSAFFRLADVYPLPWVSFCRRDETRVRRYRIENIRRHVAQSQSTTAATSNAASGLDVGA